MELLLVLVVLLFLCESEAQPLLTDEVVRAAPGQDVTLMCTADVLTDHSAVLWTRRDLEPKYIMFYRDLHLDLHLQVPRYQDRVTMVHRDLQNNDVSVVVQNLSLEDSGVYLCRVLQGGATDLFGGEPLKTIELVVSDPGTPKKIGEDEEEPDSQADRALAVALPVPAVVLLLGIGLFFGIRLWQRNLRRAETETEMSTVS